MEDNNGFKSVSYQKERYSFSKFILVPFISGIIGTSLVIGTCFGIPKIRNKILDDKSEVDISTSLTSTSVNTTAISLEEYSDTAIAVADKVLPSIVGIEIEYNVNSFFGKSSANATGSGIIISEDRIYINK